VLNALQAGIVGLPNVGKVGAALPPPRPWRTAPRRPAPPPRRCPPRTQPPAPHRRPPSHPAPKPPTCAQSTLFNAIVENGKAAAANFPFCTIEPNVGIVTVPDARLEQLSKISGSKEIVSPGRGEGGAEAGADAGGGSRPGGRWERRWRPPAPGTLR
jgi:hypothetical protein